MWRHSPSHKIFNIFQFWKHIQKQRVILYTTTCSLQNFPMQYIRIRHHLKVLVKVVVTFGILILNTKVSQIASFRCEETFKSQIVSFIAYQCRFFHFQYSLFCTCTCNYLKCQYIWRCHDSYGHYYIHRCLWSKD